METFGTITPSFQLHIPVNVRKLAGLTKHGRVKITVKKKKIMITPVKDDIMELSGKYYIKNPIPADKIRDYIDYSEA